MIASPGLWTAETFPVAAPAAWYDPTSVTPFSLVVVCLAVLGLIVAAMWPAVIVTALALVGLRFSRSEAPARPKE